MMGFYPRFVDGHAGNASSVADVTLVALDDVNVLTVTVTVAGAAHFSGTNT